MNLDKTKVLAILGDPETCKTNYAFSILNNYHGKRQIYLYGYPKSLKGYKTMNTLQELSLTKNGIIFMDELQKHIKFYQRSMNDTLLEVLSTCRHNNNTLVFTTPLTQFITKALDSFIDGFAYTKISDLGGLKNGSKAKRKLQQFSVPELNQWNLDLEKGKVLEICDSSEIGKNGVKTFKDQKIGKDWGGK